MTASSLSQIELAARGGDALAQGYLDALGYEGAEAWARAERFRELAHVRAISEVVLDRLATVAGRSETGRAAVILACIAALDHYGAGAPDTAAFDENVAQRTDDWARYAGPHELRAMARSLVEHIADAPLLDRMVRDLMALLWQRARPETRRAFLARVDPQGRLRGTRA